jgi:hypothetical protein
MAKQFPSDAAKDETKEFEKKTGSAAGTDTVVEGHLSGIAGSTQQTYGGDRDEARPKLEETAKKTPENPRRGG